MKIISALVYLATVYYIYSLVYNKPEPSVTCSFRFKYPDTNVEFYLTLNEEGAEQTDLCYRKSYTVKCEFLPYIVRAYDKDDSIWVYYSKNQSDEPQNIKCKPELTRFETEDGKTLKVIKTSQIDI